MATKSSKKSKVKQASKATKTLNKPSTKASQSPQKPAKPGQVPQGDCWRGHDPQGQETVPREAVQSPQVHIQVSPRQHQ